MTGARSDAALTRSAVVDAPLPLAVGQSYVGLHHPSEDAGSLVGGGHLSSGLVPVPCPCLIFYRLQNDFLVVSVSSAALKKLQPLVSSTLWPLLLISFPQHRHVAPQPSDVY